MLREVFPERRRCPWTEVFSASIPTLVLVDLQREYTAQGRTLSVTDGEEAIGNCQAALAHARLIGIPVAFLRLNLESTFFNAATEFCRWIDGFQPRGGDLMFERQKPSCYSSLAFADVIEKSGGNIVMAGFLGDGACLATAVDAFNRDHRVIFLHDASASQSFASLGERDSHAAVSGLIGLYGKTIATREWIEQTRTLKITRGTDDRRP